MSTNWKSAVRSERREPHPGAAPDQCDFAGVDVIVEGWEVGLNKVALTKTFRAGGMRLGDASDATGAVMENKPVRAHLAQFETVEQAAAALKAIGVREVRAAE
jgi:hypothetical protein